MNDLYGNRYKTARQIIQYGPDVGKYLTRSFTRTARKAMAKKGMAFRPLGPGSAAAGLAAVAWRPSQSSNKRRRYNPKAGSMYSGSRRSGKWKVAGRRGRVKTVSYQKKYGKKKSYFKKV